MLSTVHWNGLIIVFIVIHSNATGQSEDRFKESCAFLSTSQTYSCLGFFLNCEESRTIRLDDKQVYCGLRHSFNLSCIHFSHPSCESEEHQKCCQKKEGDRHLQSLQNSLLSMYRECSNKNECVIYFPNSNASLTSIQYCSITYGCTKGNKDSTATSQRKISKITTDTDTNSPFNPSFPVAAVVVPVGVVLMLLVIAIPLFLWNRSKHKWNGAHSMMQSCERRESSRTSNHYESTATTAFAKPTSSSQAKGSKEEQPSKSKGYAGEEADHDRTRTVDVEENAYFVLEQHNFYSYINHEDLLQNEQPSAANNEQSEFLKDESCIGLAPRVMLGNSDIEGIPSKATVSCVVGSDSGQKQKQDFSNPNLVSESKQSGHLHVSVQKCHQHEQELSNPYFVLDPQQPRQVPVSVQKCQDPTAIDNDYNRIHLRKPAVVGGSNDSIYKCNSSTGDAETVGEYSHLRKDVRLVSDAVHISRTELRKKDNETMQTQAATENEYNTIQFKKPFEIRGPTDGVTKCDSLTVDAEPEGEYSLLEEDVSTTGNAVDYSRAGLKKKEIERMLNATATENEYDTIQFENAFEIRGQNDGIPRCGSLTVDVENDREHSHLRKNIHMVSDAVHISCTELRKKDNESIQTQAATENEYNTIQFKKPWVICSPNDDITKCGSLTVVAETDGEFSHLGKDVSTAGNAVDYSRAELKKKDSERMQNATATENKYNTIQFKKPFEICGSNDGVTKCDLLKVDAETVGVYSNLEINVT